MSRLSARAASVLWRIGIRGDYNALESVNQTAKTEFRRWFAAHDLRTLRNCGLVTRRELQRWAGLPMELYPDELPLCPCCRQRIRK